MNVQVVEIAMVLIVVGECAVLPLIPFVLIVNVGGVEVMWCLQCLQFDWCLDMIMITMCLGLFVAANLG